MIQLLKRLDKCYFFFFIIICIILDFFIIIKNTTVPYPQIYTHNEIYKEEYKFLEGFINQKKFDQLIKYGENLSSQINELSEITIKYKSGEVSTTEFKNKIKNKKTLLDKQYLYDEVYMQYMNLLDDSKNIFTDINGLTNLFEMNISISLVFLISYMVCVLFVNDNEIGISNIYEATPMKIEYFKKRLLIICGFSAAFLLIHELLKILYIYFIFGFGDCKALIVSSVIFEGTIFHTTFCSTYVIYVLIKFLGCIFTSIILSIVGEKINHILYFVMFILCVFLFPFIIINNQKILNYLLWIGLNQPVYYFFGTKTNSETQTIIFNHFSINEIIFIIIISMFIILFLLQFHKKKIFVFTLVLSILLSGCSNYRNVQKEGMVNINNSITKKGFCANNIYTFDINNGVMFENKDRNIKYTIERNIFVDDYQLSCGDIFNNNYYYVISTPSYYQIKRLNIDNFTSEVLYEHKISNEDKLFKDVLNLYRYSFDSSIELPRFLIGNYNYLSIIYNKKIGIFDLNKKKFIKYIDDVVYQNNMTLYNHDFYYLDTSYQLVKIDLIENKSTIISDIPIETFFIDENHIYFKPLNENKIFLFSNNHVETFLNIESNYFFVQGVYLYYIDINDLHAYQYNLETKKKDSILDMEIYTFQIHYNDIIFSFYNDKSEEIEIGYEKKY